MRKAHFIGIAGKGMSATALLLREAGWQISGSDEGFYPPVSDYLRAANISFATPYRKENIPADADLIVISKNAKLVPESNEEVAAAFTSGKQVRSFPDILSDLTEEAETIVVAGSYGKSTITALLAWCLKQAGKDPSYFIGEVTKGFNAHAHAGKGDVFILEGDEYPSANWDPTSKFLHYHAKNVLLTSATHDHVNVFPTHAEYLTPFRALIASLPADGLLVANACEPQARALAAASPARTVFYSDPAQWHARDIRYGLRTAFMLMRGGDQIVGLTTTLLGAHNVENIVGASAMLLEKDLLTAEELAAGIASFEGVKRRMENLSPDSRVPVYEGFGSSYEKALAAIQATKLHFPDKPLVIVFEPHTFSWRNRAYLHLYDTIFAEAGKVFVLPPETQGAATHVQVTQAEILTRIGARSEPYPGPDGVARALSGNEVVLIQTSGSLRDTLSQLVDAVTRAFPA
ncbi:hypothetical protein HYV30_04480 [Candidatus Kaiserbacteria bacterium]|nr:hypothetical protein [Candidatus Kaiserbacteria bacterium]